MDFQWYKLKIILYSEPVFTVSSYVGYPRISILNDYYVYILTVPVGQKVE